MTLTPDAERKLHVLTLLEGKRISRGQAAEALGGPPGRGGGSGWGSVRRGRPPSCMGIGAGGPPIGSRRASGPRSSRWPAGGMPGSMMSTSPRSSQPSKDSP
jgi:hypothetical protein